jgi:hypothetical protein
MNDVRREKSPPSTDGINLITDEGERVASVRTIQVIQRHQFTILISKLPVRLRIYKQFTVSPSMNEQICPSELPPADSSRTLNRTLTLRYVKL